MIMKWIHNVCLMAMIFVIPHGPLHIRSYTLSCLYFEYGNAYLRGNHMILLYCNSLIVDDSSDNSILCLKTFA